MDWYTYMAKGEARPNAPLGRGIMAVNKKTGAIKMGDGTTLLRDLDEYGGDSGGGSSADLGGFRILRGSLYGSDNDVLVAGQPLDTLLHGEHVAQVLHYIVTPFDSDDAQISFGTPTLPDGPQVFTGGSVFVGGDNATNPDPNEYTGLVDMPFLASHFETDASSNPGTVSVGPPEGIAIKAYLSDGAGGDPGCTTGQVSFSLLIIGWLKPF